MKSIERVGEKYLTKNCGFCTVIQYINYKKVLVRFDDGYEKWCEYGHIKSGNVKNPMIPSFKGGGYLGDGEYGYKDKEAYHLWVSMLGRVHDSKNTNKYPTYRGSKVCEEWLDFQNFAKWCETQEFFKVKDYRGKCYQLDKDILVKGNKVYSPETCCFVPQEINKLLINSRKVRGKYPVGVYLDKKYQKFKAQFSLCGTINRHLGYFSTPEEAFSVYKTAKESYIKEVAERWKGSISENCYLALMSWEVKVDD